VNPWVQQPWRPHCLARLLGGALACARAPLAALLLAALLGASLLAEACPLAAASRLLRLALVRPLARALLFALGFLRLPLAHVHRESLQADATNMGARRLLRAHLRLCGTMRSCSDAKEAAEALMRAACLTGLATGTGTFSVSVRSATCCTRSPR
jgi:hypothetical protein